MPALCAGSKRLANAECRPILPDGSVRPIAVIKKLLGRSLMRHSLAVVTAAILLGCSSVTHDFTVDVKDAGSPVGGVQVSVCDRQPQALSRDGSFFRGTVTDRCEGQGFVRVSFADGSKVDCRIGYITTLSDRWSFKISDHSCESIET